MKRATSIALGICTALTLGLTAAAANAHPHGSGPGRGAEQGYANPAARAEARLAYLKSELKITPDQETAWKTFAEQTKQRAEAMQSLRTTLRGSTAATAPERLELRSRIMKARQEQMEKSTAAFKELYAALTPEQRTAADQRFGAGRGHGRGHHGGFGGRFG